MAVFLLIMTGIIAVIAFWGTFDMLKQLNNLPDDEDKE